MNYTSCSNSPWCEDDHCRCDAWEKEEKTLDAESETCYSEPMEKEVLQKFVIELQKKLEGSYIPNEFAVGERQLGLNMGIARALSILGDLSNEAGVTVDYEKES